MKIFVAYGYNERDRWIPELIFPIIEAFGSEVVTGEKLFQDTITEQVRTNIMESDTLIAFTTRRDQLANGLWTTHNWVKEELTTAINNGLLAVEVRERDVDPQGGIEAGRQYIEYYESQRDSCLIKIVEALGEWHRLTAVRLHFMQENFVDVVRPLLRDRRLRCTYKIYRNNRESEDYTANILRMPGGLFIDTPMLPRGASIQVHIECGAESWTSDYQSIEAINIMLSKD